MWSAIATAIVAVTVLVGVVGVRSFSGGRIKVKLADAIIAAIAAVLTIFLSGGASEFGIGPEGLTVKAAIVTAAQQSVAPQVAPLPVASLQQVSKSATSDLASLAQRQPEALE